MGYTFRIHIEISDHARLDIDTSRHELTSAGASPSVRLTTGNDEISIEKADTLYLIGGSYASRSDAEDAAMQWRTAVQGSFAKLRIGADFGDRVPREPTQQPAHRMMEQQFGVPTFEGYHGTLVVEDDPSPSFITGHATMVNTLSPSRLATALKGAFAAPRTSPQAKDEAAYDLFSASFFETNPEARIILLTSAIEAFHGLQLSGPVTRTLQNFVAGQLPMQQYGQMSSSDYFIHCYDIRGDIVHGQANRLDRAGVTAAADELERLVADLLAGPFPAG
ncbi:hypothetical protein [Nocardia salmonicida]|uniref:hypothetical protein n=2 Tax=Nocardia salmonicida TaxID=53431 RepID=UPI002E2B6C81|nr:hypothetical protein [Nocardia salmonicida]